MMAAPTYWAQDPTELARTLGSGPRGLTSAEAERRLAEYGPNELRPHASASRLRVLWRQVRSPLVLLLVFAAVTSIVTGELLDASIVGAILAAGIGVGFVREYRAETAIQALLERVQITADVVRDGTRRSLPLREMVPGDVFELSAGTIIPADGVLLEANELHVDDAVLTGESFPVLKRVGAVAMTAPPRDRAGCVQFGTNVRSGTAIAVAVATGASTAFGAIAGRLAIKPPETEFERGLRRFGLLLLVAMLVMIFVVFAVNVILGRPPIDTLLFSIALAVGLSPELLPAIVGINLANAASKLSEIGVLVRRLDAIENLGSMNVLCTDKTGTLTEGVVRVDGAYDPSGATSPTVMELALLNASLQAGLPNPIDTALLATHGGPPAATRVAEIPYDFTRKRLSVIVRREARIELITKGAVATVLDACTPLPPDVRAAVDHSYREWSARGVRVIAVAHRVVPEQPRYSTADERDLELAGFITFVDRPKPDAAAALAELRDAGVRVKMITGDNQHVARHVATQVGLVADAVITGSDLDALTDIALVHVAAGADVFAEVAPNQKERILRALRRGGAVVGFFGDGVNDAPAMHAADVSISVESAVDVAKSTADLVLTKKSLEVIKHGIDEGRHTFANTLKYILTTTSANLGNMISMAVASLVLPFLPLTAGQVLLNNFLSDIPAVGIAGDRVDPELVAGPRRWDTRYIGRFMLEYGLLSSAFDALTFVVLLVGFDASVETFRTGWFVESLFTELVIALVVRTQRPLWKSRPGSVLAWSTAAVAILAFSLPYVPFASVFGLDQPPPLVMVTIVGITALYVIGAELLKTRERFARRRRAAAPAAEKHR